MVWLRLLVLLVLLLLVLLLLVLLLVVLLVVFHSFCVLHRAATIR